MTTKLWSIEKVPVICEGLPVIKDLWRSVRAEIVHLTQLQQHSKDQLIAMENRLRTTEDESDFQSIFLLPLLKTNQATM
ncbi:hypothetical protein LXL04_007405 [Taraxacum kok-saghyz]